MVRVTALSSPFLLGFDDIERALDKVSKSAGDGYPPYNIERIAAAGGEPEKLRITLAVAGFARDQIEVTIEENQLTIRGRQQEEPPAGGQDAGVSASRHRRAAVPAKLPARRGHAGAGGRSGPGHAFDRSSPAAAGTDRAKDSDFDARLTVGVPSGVSGRREGGTQ